MRRLLVAKTGNTLDSLRARRGDYEDWIVAGLGLRAEQMAVARVFEGEPLPPAGEPAGVVVTGSSAMVSDREPWSERTAAWLREVVVAGTPVLGICFGHQLLAHALGGRVAANPRGREIGTIELRLRRAARRDALLGVLPARCLVQATHVECVLELPGSARPLASSDGDAHQAFAVGPAAWGVQFHPEFDADVMRSYLAERSAALRAEGLDAAALLARVAETPHGTSLLRRFAGLCGARLEEPAELGAPES